MRRREIWSWCVLCVAFLSSRVGLAQEAMGAEVLFDQGVNLMRAGQFSEACPKIAESQRLEPRPGTLFTLAECHLNEGKLATALARYDEYLRLFDRMSRAEKKKQRTRPDVAQKKRDELGPRVPRLKLSLPEGAPAGTRVLKGTTELGAASLGVWLPVDPGTQALAVESPDGRRKDQPVELPEGKSLELTLELPPKAEEKDAAPPVAKPHPVERPHASNHPRAKPHTSRNNTPAYVALGVGAAGMALGTVTGILVLQKKSKIDDNCGIGGDEHACNGEGKSEADSAKTLALFSTIGFAVGVAGVGTGTVLLLSGSSSTETGANARVGVRGRW